MIKCGGVAKLCRNDFLIQAYDKNVIKCGGVAKLCRNDFFIQANDKNVIKYGGVVKLCRNDFLVQANEKNVIKCGEWSNYAGIIFFLHCVGNQYVQLKLIILNLFIIFWKSRVE